MAQFQPPVTFTAGQVLTASALNAHVSSAILLPGAVTDQTDLAANTVAVGDSLIIHDLSALALREATASDLLNSGLPVTASTATIDTTVTSVVNGKANKDINLTPNDGVAVTGKAFTSVDGITAVVTSLAHGLETGMLLDITASNPVYTGQFFITVVSVDTFSFVVSQTTPVAASGTLDYTKKATVKSYGNHHISGRLNIGGSAALNGSFTCNGSLTSTGTANFTGVLQVNGTVGYALTEIIEANISYTGTPATGTWTSTFTSASYTKPVGEIWIIEVDYRFRNDAVNQLAVRLNQTTPSTVLDGTFNVEGGTGNYLHIEDGFFRYVFQDAATFTSTFTLDFQPSLAGYTLTVGETTYPVGGVFTGVTLPVSKFRIYKYKTA